MPESRVMLLHYATAALILIFAGTHLAVHSFAPLAEAPTFGDKSTFGVVLINFENIIYTATLELLLITVALHSINGVRVVALEWHQGPTWTRLVTWGVIVLGVAIVGLGTYTILVARTFPVV